MKTVVTTRVLSILGVAVFVVASMPGLAQTTESAQTETAESSGSSSAPASARAGKIWSGVFTEEQTERGKVPFTGVCRRCHADNLGGSRRGPALKGASFMADWEAQDLKRLFDKIRDTMPPDNPSSLDDTEYLDVITYILKNNGYPAGKEELTPEATENIQIMGPVGEAPKAARNFSVVEVVGCLARSADGAWSLTDTTEPRLTGGRPSTPEELNEAKALPQGTLTFRLVSASPFKPEAHVGERVDAKGLLYRAENKDRLNVGSLQAVGSKCTS